MMNFATKVKFQNWIKICQSLGIGVTENMEEMSLDDAFRVLKEQSTENANLRVESGKLGLRLMEANGDIDLLQKRIADLTTKLANKCIECGEAQERAADLQWRLDELSV